MRPTLLPSSRPPVLPTFGVVLLLGLGVTVVELGAQTAVVIVRETDAGPPVPGAIVRLLRGDSVIAQGLTNESGRVTLAGRAGDFAVRVSRIGFAASAPAPIRLAAGETSTLEISAPSERVRLPELIVAGRTSCGRSTPERELAATLWDQIRQALTATRLSERAGMALRTSRIERTLLRDGVVVDSQISAARVTGSRPFVSTAPEVLARQGYVLSGGDSVLYRAPDADVLLSDAFVASHCFGVSPAPARDTTLVGLSFEPVRGGRVSDISGVLWADQLSLELRRLEFQYVSPGRELLVTAGSGYLEFDHLATGAWYIRSWAIRMPQIERTMSGATTQDAVAGYREHGGSGEPLEPVGGVAPAYLTGRVWDSLAGSGLPGVRIVVAGIFDTAVTDSLGHFQMALSVSGSRQVSFRHPLLALDPTREVRTVNLIPAGLVSLQIGTLGLDALVGTVCAARRGRAGLVGRVTSRDSALSGVYVTAEWEASPAGGAAVHRTETTAAAASGVWAFCDLPPGPAVRLRVGEDTAASRVMVGPLAAGAFRWVPLVLGRTGRVAIASGEAQRLPELTTTGSRALADDRRFLEDARARVLRSGAPASALITRSDLEKNTSTRMLPLLVSRGLKSRINPRTGKPTLVCAHKAERPAIYLNGLLVDGGDTPGARRMRLGMVGEVFDLENLPPDDLEAVEVYRSMSERPPEYNRTLSECVVVIWTRRGGS